MAGLSDADRMAIEAIVLRFFRLVDEGKADETPALFAADATLTFAPGSPKPGTIAGAAIAAAMQARAAQREVTTRHVLTNMVVDGQGDGLARCASLLTLYRTDAARPSPFPPTVADVTDMLRSIDGIWRIQARTITPIFG